MMAAATVAPNGLPSLRYPDTAERNPAFDAAGFMRRWATRLGSVHRHYRTRELVLFHPSEFRADERQLLQQELEGHPGNIGSLLAEIDDRNERGDRQILEANARYLAAGKAVK